MAAIELGIYGLKMRGLDFPAEIRFKIGLSVKFI